MVLIRRHGSGAAGFTADRIDPTTIPGPTNPDFSLQALRRVRVWISKPHSASFLGGGGDDDGYGQRRRHLHINLLLAAAGQPVCEAADTRHFIATSRDLLETYREKSRLLAEYLCPADQRIQNFLDLYLADLGPQCRPRLPATTLFLHRHGLARELSFPLQRDYYESAYLKELPRQARGAPQSQQRSPHHRG